MSLLDTVGSAALGVLSGGVTGIFGVAVQRIADYQNKKLDIEREAQSQAHEIAKMKLEGDMMEKEYAARTQIAATEAQGREAVADAGAFAESMRTEPQKYSDGVKATGWQAGLLVILDFIRGLVRPLMTVALLAATIWIYAEAVYALRGLAMSSEQALQREQVVVGTILYLFTTVTLWWFGTRNKQQAPGLR